MSRISAYSQLFPPAPTWTEKDMPDLTGRVYIVTGSNTGLGYEVARLLYAQNATVYGMARDGASNAAALAAMRAAHPASRGRLEHVALDLGDLRTVRASADAFLAREAALHGLFNNAGVMFPPRGAATAQGYELQLGTNCVGPFLLTRLLTPVLVATARGGQEDVRVVWVSSNAAENLSPGNGGLDVENLDYKKDDGLVVNALGQKYGISKAGNWYHSCEFARRHRKDGVISVTVNPGNLSTNLGRHLTGFMAFVGRIMYNPPIYGAYVQLFAGVSDQVTLEKSGCWVVPWGRFSLIRDDMEAGTKPVSEGGTGLGQKFWEWSEEQVKPYL